MVFSSIIFLLFFLPCFIFLYHFADRKYKNYVILFSSILFYSWGAPKFIFVILGTTFIDFHLVKYMSQSKKVLHRRLLLLLSVSINIGLLFYFKYSNFFIENVNQILSLGGVTNIQWTKLVLPIGISFYTFETITYVVDVYRKIHKPLNSFIDYQLYIIFFPKLIAGPIIRYHELADQINAKDRAPYETSEQFLMGFYRFAIGLAKKVMIANPMGLQADTIFSMQYINIDATTAWIGILAYTFQIYFDFAGYSDMAIGIAKMVGFRFPENFNNPYISQSITDFWRRWHISLGNWMRNYLYIPLGGNRVKSKNRVYFNLWLVFIASGLWHGASWNFVIWGAYHGLFLVLERAFLLKLLQKIGKIPSIIFTFFIVVIGWVFFRVEHTNDAFTFISKMFSFNFSNSFNINIDFKITFILALFFAFWGITKFGNKIQNHFYFGSHNIIKHFSWVLISIVLIITAIGSITASGFNPFIYFRF